MTFRNSRYSYQWRVTLEHRNGLDQESFYMAAFSGYQAQKIARAKLRAKGKRDRYFAMIGLARLSS